MEDCKRQTPDASQEEIRQCFDKNGTAAIAAMDAAAKVLQEAQEKAKDFEEYAGKNFEATEADFKAGAASGPNRNFQRWGAESYEQFSAKFPGLKAEQQLLLEASREFGKIGSTELRNNQATRDQLVAAQASNRRALETGSTITGGDKKESGSGGGILKDVSSQDIANMGAASSALANAAKGSDSKEGGKSSKEDSSGKGGVSPTTANGSGNPKAVGRDRLAADSSSKPDDKGGNPADTAKTNDLDKGSGTLSLGGHSGASFDDSTKFNSKGDQEYSSTAKATRALASSKGSGGVRGSEDSGNGKGHSSSDCSDAESCAKATDGASPYSSSGQLGASHMTMGGAGGATPGKGDMSPEELLGLSKLQSDAPLTDEEKKWLGLDSDAKVADPKAARALIAEKMAAEEVAAVERNETSGNEISTAESPGLFARVRHMHRKAQLQGMVAGMKQRI